MALVGAGDPNALAAIFDRHSSTAFSLAYRMCGRQAMAEDIVQEAFIALWRTAGTYDPSRASVRSWLLSVVRHRAIDAFRRDVRASRDVSDAGLAEWLSEPSLTELEVERREEAEHIRGALRELPDEQRRVIELAYFGGFTHTEIATMLELSVGTVKGRMRLGLTKLRVSFGAPASSDAGDRTHG
jgi:RNA polymerase sigma-70 factor (ECF subfamily)